MFLTLLYFTYYGVACVAITPNLMVAAILSGAFYGLMNLFAGFVIPQPEFPGWWIWVRPSSCSLLVTILHCDSGPQSLTHSLAHLFIDSFSQYALPIRIWAASLACGPCSSCFVLSQNCLSCWLSKLLGLGCIPAAVMAAACVASTQGMTCRQQQCAA